MFITNFIIFGGQFPVSVRHYPVDFIFIPFIVWASFRFEKAGLGLTLLLTSGFAIWGTIHGYGPFVHLSLNDSLLLLQMFIGIVTVLGIMLSAVLAERRKAEVRHPFGEAAHPREPTGQRIVGQTQGTRRESNQTMERN